MNRFVETDLEAYVVQPQEEQSDNQRIMNGVAKRIKSFSAPRYQNIYKKASTIRKRIKRECELACRQAKHLYELQAYRQKKLEQAIKAIDGLLPDSHGDCHCGGQCDSCKHGSSNETTCDVLNKQLANLDDRIHAMTRQLNKTKHLRMLGKSLSALTGDLNYYTPSESDQAIEQERAELMKERDALLKELCAACPDCPACPIDKFFPKDQWHSVFYPRN